MPTIATIPDMDIEIIQFSSKAICVQCPESLITIDNIIVYLRQGFATGIFFYDLKWGFVEQDLFYETYRRIAIYNASGNLTTSKACINNILWVVLLITYNCIKT